MPRETTPDPRPVKPRRPFGVTIIAVLLLVNGMLAVVRGGMIAVEFYNEQQGTIEPGEISELTEDFSLLDWLTLPVSAAGIVMAWGMWTLHPGAWFATMFLQGLYLLAQIYDYSQGDRPYGNLLITVLTVFYLNQRDVQLVFRGWRDERRGEPERARHDQ